MFWTLRICEMSACFDETVQGKPVNATIKSDHFLRSFFPVNQSMGFVPPGSSWHCETKGETTSETKRCFASLFFANFDCGSWVKDSNAVLLHHCQSMSQPGYPQLREIYLHMALLQPFDSTLCWECSEKEETVVKQQNFGWNLKIESGSKVFSYAT